MKSFTGRVIKGVASRFKVATATGAVSCLHDYTLSVDDMKRIEGADVIALNGAEAAALLKSLGFEYLTVPCRGKHIEVEI